jgi:transcriptional regulator with XRE-family HTH domain
MGEHRVNGFSSLHDFRRSLPVLLADRRRELGYTQRYVEQQAKLPAGWMSRVERGVQSPHRSPRVLHLDRVLQVLDMQVKVTVRYDIKRGLYE